MLQKIIIFSLITVFMTFIILIIFYCCYYFTSETLDEIIIRKDLRLRIAFHGMDESFIELWIFIKPDNLKKDYYWRRKTVRMKGNNTI